MVVEMMRIGKSEDVRCWAWELSQDHLPAVFENVILSGEDREESVDREFRASLGAVIRIPAVVVEDQDAADSQGAPCKDSIGQGARRHVRTVDVNEVEVMKWERAQKLFRSPFQFQRPHLPSDDPNVSIKALLDIEVGRKRREATGNFRGVRPARFKHIDAREARGRVCENILQ